MKFRLGYMVLLSLLYSCASSYKAIGPDRLSYGNANGTPLLFSYKYDVLALAGNKKHPKKERKYDILLVAIKIQNTSDRPVAFDKIQFYTDNNEIYPMNKSDVYEELKENAISFALYSLIVLVLPEYNCQGLGCELEINAIIPVGVPFAIGNMIFAGSANRQFHRELDRYDLSNVTIRPSETVFGLIGFHGIGYEPLKIMVTP